MLKLVRDNFHLHSSTQCCSSIGPQLPRLDSLLAHFQSLCIVEKKVSFDEGSNRFFEALPASRFGAEEIDAVCSIEMDREELDSESSIRDDCIIDTFENSTKTCLLDKDIVGAYIDEKWVLKQARSHLGFEACLAMLMLDNKRSFQVPGVINKPCDLKKAVQLL